MHPRAWPKALERLGVVAGSPTAKAVYRAVRKLADLDDLPPPGDEEIVLPPAAHAWSHAVPGSSFEIIYSFDAERVTFRTLRIRAPY